MDEKEYNVNHSKGAFHRKPNDRVQIIFLSTYLGVFVHVWHLLRKDLAIPIGAVLSF